MSNTSWSSDTKAYFLELMSRVISEHHDLEVSMAGGGVKKPVAPFGMHTQKENI